jgi:hypothetical protein
MGMGMSYLTGLGKKPIPLELKDLNPALLAQMDRLQAKVSGPADWAEVIDLDPAKVDTATMTVEAVMTFSKSGTYKVAVYYRLRDSGFEDNSVVPGTIVVTDGKN